MNQRVFSSLFRVATLAIRFAFIFFLAKFLTPAEVGLYGLFAAAIGYALYLVGLDFYTYSTRATINMSRQDIGRALKGQAALSGVLYIIATPLTLGILFAYSGWPFYMIGIFVPILFLEHFNQEIFRFLVAQSEQMAASILLFIRQASWGVVAVACMMYSHQARNLALILFLWCIAGILAALGGALKLSVMGISGWRATVDWVWVKKGALSSISFLISTLALRAIQTFDRYALEAIGGIEIVGAYVLFMGIAGSLLAFLDAGVFSFSYPKLIKSKHEEDEPEFSKQMRHMFWSTLTMCITFCLASYILLPYFLNWLGKEAYSSSIYIFYWVALAAILNAIGLVPHYALYAMDKDRLIIISHILALIVFIGGVFLLKPHTSILSIPQSMSVAFAFILTWKSIFYFLDHPSK